MTPKFTYLFLTLTYCSKIYGAYASTCQLPANQDLIWLPKPTQNPYIYFTIPETQRSWSDAGVFCNFLGSDSDKINLARSMDEFENMAILESLEILNQEVNDVWLAGHALKNDDDGDDSALYSGISSDINAEWRWFQRNAQLNQTLILPLNYTNWAANQSNQLNSIYLNSDQGNWFTDNPENEKYFICEYRCDEQQNSQNQNNSTYPNNLIFTTGEAWLTPNLDYKHSLVGEINLPKEFQISVEFKFVEIPKHGKEGFSVLTLGSYYNGVGQETFSALPQIFILSDRVQGGFVVDVPQKMGQIWVKKLVKK